MPRVHQAYESASHNQKTSTGTANVQTQPAPANYVAVMISVETNDARLTLDGSTPSGSNGLLLKAGMQPWFIPIAMNLTFKHTSAASADSVVNYCWLS